MNDLSELAHDHCIEGSMGLIDKVVMIGRDGEIWGIAGRWKITSEEAQVIAQQVKQPALFMARGISLGGIKYMGLVSNEENFQGYKHAVKGGVNGIISDKVIIIGGFSEPHQNSAAHSFMKGVCLNLLEASKR